VLWLRRSMKGRRNHRQRNHHAEQISTH
jgi:hypothetical protein